MSAVWILLLFSFSQGLAQTTPPHAQKGVETGLIEGEIFLHGQEKKTPLGDEVVALMVFKDGERVLMLDKSTDAKGHFQFKNIFKDPSYSYALGTIHEGELYVVSGIQLASGEEKRFIEFPVGKGSPYAMAEMPGKPAVRDDLAMEPSVNPEKASFSVNSVFGHSYQKVVLALSLFVLLMSLYYALKPWGQTPHRGSDPK